MNTPSVNNERGARRHIRPRALAVNGTSNILYVILNLECGHIKGYSAHINYMGPHVMSGKAVFVCKECEVIYPVKEST
jgi:hypothetical protein